MKKPQAIKIASSTFKFIAALDLFAASFIKDEDLFPSDAAPADREALYEEYAADLPYGPLFAISAGDMKPRRFEYKDKFIQSTPGPNGLPTIRDFDVLIYCVTWIANAALEGRDGGVRSTYEFEVEDFYKLSGRPRNGDRDNLFIQGLERLSGCEITTNTRPIGLENPSLNLIEEYEVGKDGEGRLKSVRIKLPHTIYCLAHNEYFVPIHSDYFTLSAARRQIYLFIKLFCGGRDALLVPFAKLHEITSSTSPLRKFLPVIDELVTKPLPEYSSVKIEGAEKISVTFIG
jgi:hypothetical protein